MDGGYVRRVETCREALLRFRPIAPKPVPSGSFGGGVLPEKVHVFAASKRVKRKYVRVRKDGNTPNPKKKRNSDNNSGGESVTLTLQLMPARSDGGDAPGRGSGFFLRRQICGELEAKVSPDHQAKEVAVESWVTVEDHVSDAWMEGRALGGTDEERVRALERDTCPGFVSDGSLSKVEWVNDSYRRMVAASLSAGRTSPDSSVRLSAASRLGFRGEGPSFFTCRVRVQNYYLKHDNSNRKIWKIMPCDVWRLDCGGFAWRLDVNAALSLGL